MQKEIVLSLSLSMLLSTCALAEDTPISIDGVSVDSQIETEKTGIGTKSVVDAKKIKTSLTLADVAHAESVNDKVIILDVITAKPEAMTAKEDSNVGSHAIVTREKIETFNNYGMASAYQAISLEPGVDVRANDPTGTNANYKIRGNSSRGQALIIEGLPFKGIGIGQPASDLVDMENIEMITVEKGAVPANGKFGFGNVIDMKLMRPSDQLSVTGKQTFGSNDFTKTFVRLDSGKLGGNTKGFFSSSLTETDKFKGTGKSLDRKNFAFGIMGELPSDIEWEVFGIHNDQKRDHYKGLNYEQSTSLGSNWSRDYNPNKTGTSAEDINYYRYNRDDYSTSTILGKLKLPVGQDSHMSFRPYYTVDKGKAFSGSSGTMVNFDQQKNVIVESLLDRETFGAVLEYEKSWQNSRFSVGYWYGEHEPPGPPISRKARDTDLNFIGWVNLFKVENRYNYRSPYISFSTEFDKASVDLGLKHVSISSAKFVSYNTAGVGDVNYNQALEQADIVDFTLPSNTYRLWLPSIGVTYYLDEKSSIKSSFGKNFDWPNFGWASSAIGYFKNLGYDEAQLQDLWAKRVRPPENNEFDIGYNYSSGRLSLTSAMYYKQLKYIQANIYDPSVGMTLAHNSGKGRSYGFELGSSYDVLDNLVVNMAFSYNSASYTSDVQTGVDTTVAAKGKQLPDRPKMYGNISAAYEINGYRIAPVVRYLDKRYVDVLNKYSVSSTWLTDLSISKDITMGGSHSLQVSLSVMNLFDKKYISTISTSDINTNQGAPTYMVGAPRTIFGSLSYKF